MLEEFKKFAMRGNVVDLAIGVIIGAAFGAIVNSAVADILMPVIGALTGGLDFTNYFIRMSDGLSLDILPDCSDRLRADRFQIVAFRPTQGLSCLTDSLPRYQSTAPALEPLSRPNQFSSRINPQEQVDMSGDEADRPDLGALLVCNRGKVSVEKLCTGKIDQRRTAAGGPDEVNEESMAHAPICAAKRSS